MERPQPKIVSQNRRKFIKETGIAVLGSSLAFNIGYSKPAKFNQQTLKVGLVGCGGRGTGAAEQALSADPDVVLTAMADIFPDRLKQSYDALNELHPDKVKVDEDHKFIGFDAYKKLIESEVDVVLLATPPAFRPDHLTTAIDSGKHVFAEKPMAVDAPGVRKVLAAAKKAQEKGLSLTAGYCLRYDNTKRAFFKKILNGEIGEIRSMNSTRYGGELWYKPRQPHWSQMEYQLRNWYYYDWLSGDFVVEMHVHNIDLMAWAMGNRTPVQAVGIGGRQVRVDEKYGNIYDHIAVEFEYEDGARGYHFGRQFNGCSSKQILDIVGTKGTANIDRKGKHQITTDSKWEYNGEENNMYQTEHDELFASIRNGTPTNDGEWMANTTMLGILARMVSYSGQTITWEEALNSDKTIGPAIDQYAWDLEWPNGEIAVPGTTQVL
ncbi:MAG: oxidoreductase [Cyclobacteriaceae bacterium]|nr:MAG: oxidoreductase [Cyclobacteriaceae bacterium]